MTMRIPWDKYETAILIDACIQIINNKMDKNATIKIVSEKLRCRAINSGLAIDNIYRNENGIRMQMTIIMSIIQDEKPGLYNASKLFYEMVEMYRADYKRFSSIRVRISNRVNGNNIHKQSGGKILWQTENTVWTKRKWSL